MKIAYMTLDEVHENLVRKMAEARGANFCALAVQGSSPDCFDAVIYDLDFLPEERREAVLAQLLSGSLAHRAAVHSYNLRKRQRQGLRRRGIIVGRTPQNALSKVLGELAAETAWLASRSIGPAVPPHNAYPLAEPGELSAASSK
jgi:hypothetical protein